MAMGREYRIRPTRRLAMFSALVLPRLSLLAIAGWSSGCAPLGSGSDAGAGDAAAQAPAAGRAGFGFRGFEIYKVGDGTSALVPGDFDGDDLGDFALVDNRRSRVERFRRLAKDAPDAPDPDKKSGPNALAYGGRFERTRFPVEKRVLQLAAGDWNADGQDDLAWVVEGGELTVLWSVKGAAPREDRRTIDALRKGCSGLESADFDRDGKEDLLFVAPDQLLGMSGGSAKGLGDPVVLDPFDAAPARLFVTDLDGQTGADLLYAYLNEDAPLRYRLARAGGGFGPRIDVEMPQIRSVEITAPAADRHGVLAVFKLSGRLSELAFSPLEAGRRSLLRSALRKPAERGDVKRTFACGDLDGDGCDDVLVSEPETAAVTVFWGSKETGATSGAGPKSYPNLSGLVWPRLADLDGDGRKEVVGISAAEKMLGVARLAGAPADRDLGFPATSPIEGEPAALDVADVDQDGRDDVIVLVAQGEGRARKHVLEVRAGNADGTLAKPAAYPIEGLKKTPFALRMIDLDRDEKLDALAFSPGEKAVPALVLSRGGAFVADDRGEDAPGLGILAGVGPDSIAIEDVDGDGLRELLVAQASFVRALAFDVDPNVAGGRVVPRVVVQMNAPSPDAKLSAVAFADWNGDGRKDLLVRDEATREILALGIEKDDLELLERASSARLEFAGMSAADLNGDERADLCVFGRGEIGLLLGGARESGFEEIASYEPREERVVLDQIAVGDLGGDARSEVVVTELVRHALAILERPTQGAPGGSLEHALGFEVYEKKSFEDDNPEREPREIRCADVDGDGRTDVTVLVHDKLIVYLQE